MLTIAGDTDGCSYPLHAALSEWLASEDRAQLPAEDPDCWHYWRKFGMSDAEWDVLLEAFGEAGGFRRAAPYPEFLEASTTIFDAGHDMIGVTSRPATRAVETSTYGWIADWLIPFRSVLIGPSAKLEAECDVLIDDNPEELAKLEELGEACGLLLDRPWNREDDRFARVTWSEVPSVLDGIAAAVASEAAADRPFVVLDCVTAMIKSA